MPDISISRSAPEDAAGARHNMMKDVWTYTAVLLVVAIGATLLLTGSVAAVLCVAGGVIVTVWGLLRLRSHERATDSDPRAFPRIFD
jgi:Flp pilus assembly protein TadB